MLILGINDNGHDAAASLIDGKNILFASKYDIICSNKIQGMFNAPHKTNDSFFII